MNFKGKMCEKSGITLITLVVTIIILLILAGITIATITSDNGIIKNANDAKEQTEIAEEKEIVDRATIQAMGNNKRGNLVKDELQDELDRITNVGKTDVEDSSDEFNVIFTNSNRYYTVDKDGNIIEEGKIVIDKSPGDITKDENGDYIEEDKPYEIWCIEDLIEWSQNYQNYQDSNIILGRTLNFKSNYSYSNGKMLGCNSIEELKELLTNTEETGFTPINIFSGTFDGQGFKIENIYINQEGIAGFIGKASNVCVKNLTITGTIISKNDSAGGICGNVSGDIDNCYNYATVKSYSSNSSSGAGGFGAGGFIGTGSATIMNSSNYGEIIAEKYAGGLAGLGTGSIVINCANYGNVTSNTDIAGGLLGWYTTTSNTKIWIYNSYNTGKIQAENEAGGIIGYIYTGARIKNVYNTGDIQSNLNYAGGILGGALYNNPANQIQYCYYLDNVEKGVGKNVADTTTKCQNDIMKSLDFLNELNENIKKIQTDGTDDISKWRNWVSGEEEYPIFE